jgi:hypothetical protein
MRRGMRLLPAIAFAIIAATIPAFPAAAAAPRAEPQSQSQLDLPRSYSLPDVAPSAVHVTSSAQAPRVAPLVPPACSSTFNAVASPSPGGGNNILANNALAAIAANDVWAGGTTTSTSFNKYQTLIEHWDGTSWTQIPSANVLVGGQMTDNLLYGLSAVSATDIWAVGTYRNASNVYQPLAEHYDGTAWTLKDVPYVAGGNTIFAAVKPISSTTVWVVGYQRYANDANNPSLTLAMEYNGSIWTKFPTYNANQFQNPNALLAVAASSTNDVWAVGRWVDSTHAGHTLIEHFDGTSWSLSASPNAYATGSRLYGVATLGPNAAWAVGYGWDGTKARTLIEQWDGASWTIIQSRNVGGAANQNNYLFSVTAISANNVWAVGDAEAPTTAAGQIPATGVTVAEHWNGSTWTAITSANSSAGFNELNAITAVSPTSVWAVGDFYNGSNLDQTLAENFCLASPAVTDVSPTVGNTLGGDQVAVIGDGVAFATSVSFGKVAATSFRVDSEHQVTAITPPEPDGVVDVHVATDAGTSPAAITDEFRFGPFASSIQQYSLADSDGFTWMDIDPSKLTLTITPTSDSYAILGGNVDLWTANASVNQDVGIAVSGGTGTGPGVYPTVAGQPEAWKESGGFAGTFSPNAAFVQTVLFLKQGTAYTVKLQWKTNIPAPGTRIFAGAGPWPPPAPYADFTPSGFSPTRLTAQLVPAGSAANVKAVAITTQPTLPHSDGSTWVAMDPGLSFSYTPTVDGNALLSANADLWTDTAGFNQDIGISVSGGSTPAYPTVAGQPETWKESGGYAGTYSPNAAFAQRVVPMKGGTTYNITLQWKTNRPAPPTSTIVAGAGAIAGKFSPTSLSLLFAPSPASGPNPLYQVSTTAQHWLYGPASDGITFQNFDSSVTFAVGSTTNCVAFLGANADLWTANAGYNQDIAVALNGTVVAWKESGGYAGTFSPNAAFVQVPFAVTPGRSYTLTLAWKANKPAQNAGIYAGAGPIGQGYSPTSLTLQTIGCT